jgi:hypothetical protein
MTSKVYRSAQGKSVDLGTIMLQNEHVRAVGNMNVNARGDRLDSNNQVLETKPRQIQRQNARTTNVSAGEVHTSSIKARRQAASEPKPKTETEIASSTTTQPETLTQPPVQDETAAGRVPTGGLAAAIARSREVKQELEKTQRQRAREQGVKRI